MFGVFSVRSTMGSAADGAIQNKNPNIPREESVPTLKRMFEMGSSSGGNEQDSGKGSHRHTAHQIQAMESFFQVCQHPNDKERLQLSHDLGLKPSQVKFWFQNRRTQMKAQQDRSENAALKSENERLRSEKNKLQSALRNIRCTHCSGGLEEVYFETHRLRLENARLRAEHERVSAIASRMSQSPKMCNDPFQFSGVPAQADVMTAAAFYAADHL